MIYSYYCGGYNHTYEHKVIYSVAPTPAQALETAGDGIYVASFQEFYPSYKFYAVEYSAHPTYKQFQKLNKFLHQKLTNVTLFRFCFWDWEHIYILGETTSGDWVGVETTNEFAYNP